MKSKFQAVLTFAAAISLSYANVAKVEAASLTPDQQEQVKLKSAKWGESRMQVDRLIKAAKYAEAEKILNEILEERRTLGLDLLSEYDCLGDVYLKWKKNAEAESTFKKMVSGREKMGDADDPQVAYPWRQLASCYEKLGKSTDAKAARARADAIEKSAQTMPKFGKISGTVGSPARIEESKKACQTGEKLIRADLQKKAQAYFERAIALDSKNADAFYGRAETEAWFGNYAKALADYNLAISLRSNYALAYVGRAYVHQNQKQYQLAVADFEKAVQADPKNTDAMGARAKLLDTMGKHKEALLGYNQVIETNPALYWPYIQRAVAYVALKQYKQALDDYSTLVERAPEDPDFYEYRAEVYLKSGDLQNALKDYDKLISLNPKGSVAYHQRAKIYEKLDGKKSARALGDEAMAKKLGYVPISK